jgi:hypothetical protein
MSDPTTGAQPTPTRPGATQPRTTRRDIAEAGPATGPVAVLLTGCRFLAAYLTELHPKLVAVTHSTDPRAAGLLTASASGVDPAGVLSIGDGLLVLADRSTRLAVYVSGDLDDAGIWDRAVRLGAGFVAVLPDGEPWLRDQLTDLLGPTRTATP